MFLASVNVNILYLIIQVRNLVTILELFLFLNPPNSIG